MAGEKGRRKRIRCKLRDRGFCPILHKYVGHYCEGGIF